MDFVWVNSGAAARSGRAGAPWRPSFCPVVVRAPSWLPALQSLRGRGAKRLEAPKSDTATWPEAWTKHVLEFEHPVHNTVAVEVRDGLGDFGHVERGPMLVKASPVLLQ